MESTTKKTQVLIEALPYIQSYHNKIVVIKFGGKAMINPKLRESVMKDIVLLKHVGILPVIAHGGGKYISREMKKLNIKPKFVKGLRVTDKKTLKIVEKTFNKINKEIAALIKKNGGKPISLSGKYYSIIKVKQNNLKLGFVGKITKINPGIILTLLKDDYIPIISPIGIDKNEQEYNINADTVATCLAIALKAKKLTILTDVKGVFEKGKFIQKLKIKEAIDKIKRGVISDGMIPKIEACIKAIQNGVPRTHLINGTIPHALLLEIFTDKGIGTMVYK